jgi:hypothetical protein
MSRVVPASPSIILKATRIVVVEVRAVGEGVESRLDLILRDVLKGTLDASPGMPMSATGRLASPARRELTPSGPWAAARPVPGATLVVFSSAASADPRAVLAESAILRVTGAEIVGHDVRRALALDRAGGPLQAHIAAVTEPPPLTALFGEYLMARVAEEKLHADPDGFASLMTWLEKPERSAALQLSVVQSLTGKVITDSAPGRIIDRLALAALRILVVTDDDALAGQLVDTYLPNLLGLEGSLPRRTVATVTSGDADMRARALAAVRRRPASVTRERMSDWLAS